EIDLENYTCAVEAGVTLNELGRALLKYDYIYPDYPASRHAANVCARIATNGWSYISGHFGHTEDLVVSFEVVLPTGEVVRVGGGAGGKIKKSSTGYNLKSLFFGSQGTLGIITKATVEIFPAPEVEIPSYWGFENFDDAYKCIGSLQKSNVATAGGWGLFDEKRVEFYRRDSELYIDLPSQIKTVVFFWLYGNAEEVEVGYRRLAKICENWGGRFLGEEFSRTAWAMRHETSVPPVHGRKNGEQVPMTWVMEDPAINYTAIPWVKSRWHEIIKKYGFDDWGLIFISNRRSKRGEYLAGIMMGVNEFEFLENESRWEDLINCRRDLLEVALNVGGSLSAAHGPVEKGKVELLPKELGSSFELMVKIKKLLDPNNIMNPGKYLMDEAYEK
ncbi:MAG: FAD-binding oxidoreductase, partial [Nitrososphaeria archaeon]